ncbi:MAG: hypothetical protein ACRC18_06715 [Cetobacterium sp.]
MKNIYYFTFGGGQRIGDIILEGKCQPIKADNQNNATNKMLEVYGTNWCWCYTQDEWEKYPIEIREVELELIEI